MRGAAETVLLLGMAQRSAPPAARSLRKAGYRVIGAWEGGRLAGRTRYCQELFRVPPVSDTAKYVTAVHELCEREDVAVIVPLADELLGTLVAAREPEARWVLAGPSLAEFETFSNKAALLQTAAAAGIGSPASTIVGPDGPEGTLPGLPSYVKVVSGADAGRAAGRPVRVTDARERDRVVQELVGTGVVVLVQEEVDGELWRLHFVRSGGRTAHVAARTLADFPCRVGQSTVTSFEPAPLELAEAGDALLELVGYEGPGSIDFVARDGAWLVHDVNLRLLASVGGTIAAGLDMPRLAVEIALGRAADLGPVRVRSLQCVILQGEMAALRSTLSGVPTGRSAARIALGVALAVALPGRILEPFDLSDPLPTLAALAAFARRPGVAAV